MWNKLKSTHPVIFGIGTVECIVSSDKTELVRSCALGHCSLWSKEPTQQFGSRRQAEGVSGPQAGLVLGAVTETAEGNAELPPAQEGRTSFRLCLHVWLARMSHVWRSLRVFWQAVCDQLSPFPFSLFLCRFTRLRSKLCFFGFCHNADKLKKTPCPLVF